MKGYSPVPEVDANPVEHRRKIAHAINLLLAGKMNAVTTITLTAGAATTTLTDNRITSDSFIWFQPTTANAAAEHLWTSSQTNGSVVINHANNAQTDRTYNVIIIG